MDYSNKTFSRTKKVWTAEEDALLAQVVIEDGKRRWKYIAMRMTLKSEKKTIYSPKQVRNRWENHVDPDLNKGPWTSDEDTELLSLIATFGKKWSEISRRLPGRTMHTVKNRYKSLAKHKIDGIPLPNTQNTQTVQPEAPPMQPIEPVSIQPAQLFYDASAEIPIIQPDYCFTDMHNIVGSEIYGTPLDVYARSLSLSAELAPFSPSVFLGDYNNNPNNPNLK